MLVGLGLIIPGKAAAGLPKSIFEDPPTALALFEFQQWLPEVGMAVDAQYSIVSILLQSRREPLCRPISFLAEIIARDENKLYRYLSYLRMNRARYGHINPFDMVVTDDIVNFLASNDTASNFNAFAHELGIEPTRVIISSVAYSYSPPPPLQEGQKHYNAASGDWESYDVKGGKWVGVGEGKPEYLPRGFAEMAQPPTGKR